MVNCIVYKLYLKDIMRKMFVYMTDHSIIVERRYLGIIKMQFYTPTFYQLDDLE